MNELPRNRLVISIAGVILFVWMASALVVLLTDKLVFGW